MTGILKRREREAMLLVGRMTLARRIPINQSLRLEAVEALAGGRRGQRNRPMAVGQHRHIGHGEPRHGQNQIGRAAQGEVARVRRPFEGRHTVRPGERQRRQDGKLSRPRQFKIEADIAAGVGDLMNFRRQRIPTRDQRSGIQRVDEEGCFPRAPNGRRGERLESHQAGGHAVAPDFSAVQVNHRTIVPDQTRLQGLDEGRVGNVERAAKVECDVGAAVGVSAIDGGNFSIAAETEPGRAVFPRGVVE